MSPLRTLTLAAVAAALLAPTLVAAQSAAPPGDAKRGYATFVRAGCYECHGYQGQGGGERGTGRFGPMLAPKPLAFSVVLQQVRHPRDLMPEYSPEILSDQDVADIYAYLGSIPAGKPASDIPLLRGYLQQKGS